MSNVELDNRLFVLQQRKDLTPRQRELLQKADIAYLQDRDAEASVILDILEKQLGR